MLLHLGGDWAANSRRIVAILDYGSIIGSRATKRLFAQAEKRRMLERIDTDAEARSVVLLHEGRNTRIVLSPISASALRGRLESNAPVLELGAGAVHAKTDNRKGR